MFYSVIKIVKLECEHTDLDTDEPDNSYQIVIGSICGITLLLSLLFVAFSTKKYMKLVKLVLLKKLKIAEKSIYQASCC